MKEPHTYIHNHILPNFIKNFCGDSNQPYRHKDCQFVVLTQLGSSCKNTNKIWSQNKSCHRYTSFIINTRQWVDCYLFLEQSYPIKSLKRFQQDFNFLQYQYQMPTHQQSATVVHRAQKLTLRKIAICNFFTFNWQFSGGSAQKNFGSVLMYNTKGSEFESCWKYNKFFIRLNYYI